VSGAPGRTYQYFIDREGDWWCEGWPVDDHDLRDQLSRSLFRRAGRLALRCEGEVHPVAVEVAPLFVRDVDPVAGDGGALVSIEVTLLDGRREALRPGTLRADEQERLFCDAGEPPLPALFFRPAYYRLMRYLEEDDGRYFVRIGGRDWTIRHERASGRGGST